MKLVKRALAGAGALALVISLSILAAPKAAHALSVVAALVRDVDNPARDPFQADFTATCTGSPPSINCTGLTVPTTNGAGETVSMLVIENVGGWCPAFSIASAVLLTNYSDSEINTIFETGLNNSSTSGYFLQAIASQNLAAGFSQPTRFYAAPGSRLTAIASNMGTCALTAILLSPSAGLEGVRGFPEEEIC